MMKQDTPFIDKKRELIIDKLVGSGVYKINGKQLYELPFYELMKQYVTNTEDGTYATGK